MKLSEWNVQKLEPAAYERDLEQHVTYREKKWGQVSVRQQWLYDDTDRY